MRALMIVVAGATFMFGSAFAVEVEKSAQGTAQKIVVASAQTSAPMKHVKAKAPKAAATEAPARVWSVEMACCEPQ